MGGLNAFRFPKLQGNRPERNSVQSFSGRKRGGKQGFYRRFRPIYWKPPNPGVKNTILGPNPQVDWHDPILRRHKMATLADGVQGGGVDDE